MIKVLIASLLLAGCASTARLAVESVYIDTMIRSGAPAAAIKTGGLSDSQMITLTHAINKYEQFREKWKANFSGNGLLYAGTLDDMLLADYVELKKQYIAVKNIVIANWTDYDAITRLQLEEYMKHAEALDDGVNGYLKNRQRDAAINNILQIFATVLQIGLALK
jgi:hypothetical protein